MNSTSSFFNKWIKISLFNFLLVAAVGVVLRYKITFSLRLVNQKFLLHGHSHFAFAGWLSQIIMVFAIQFIAENTPTFNIKLYNKILWANMITAYGMLCTFPFEGYALHSIIFSTLSIFVSYIFIVAAWRDLNQFNNKKYITSWFKAGLFFLGLSSLGAFCLAYFMSHHVGEAYYFGAVYFFLHFQYNAWFLFGCFGSFFYWLDKNDFVQAAGFSKKIFRILFFTCVPAYLLSVLWMDFSPIVRIVAACTAAIQLISVVYIVQLFKQSKKIIVIKSCITTRVFWYMAMIAFIIKLVLQSLCVVPSLSNYAFGFRPIVIGYLHLCFLGVLSFFILGYIYQHYNFTRHKIVTTGAYIFITGVVITETTLMLQGFFGIDNEAFYSADKILFTAAILMFAGILFMVAKFRIKTNE